MLALLLGAERLLRVLSVRRCLASDLLLNSSRARVITLDTRSSSHATQPAASLSQTSPSSSPSSPSSPSPSVERSLRIHAQSHRTSALATCHLPRLLPRERTLRTHFVRCRRVPGRLRHTSEHRDRSDMPPRTQHSSNASAAATAAAPPKKKKAPYKDLERRREQNRVNAQKSYYRKLVRRRPCLFLVYSIWRTMLSHIATHTDTALLSLLLLRMSSTRSGPRSLRWKRATRRRCRRSRASRSM